MTKKGPLRGSTPPGLAGCPLYRVPLPAQPAQRTNLVLWPPLLRRPLLQRRISQALGKGWYSGGSCLHHQWAVWAWQSSSTSLGLQSLIHDALPVIVEWWEVPKGRPQQIRWRKAKQITGALLDRPWTLSLCPTALSGWRDLNRRNWATFGNAVPFSAGVRMEKAGVCIVGVFA